MWATKLLYSSRFSRNSLQKIFNKGPQSQKLSPTMMIGDPHHQYYGLTHNSTVYNPPWDPTATIAPSSSSSSSPTPPSPLSVMTSANGSSSPASPPTVNGYFLSSHNNEALLTALSRYLPSNETEQDSPEMDDGYAKSDEFRMYEFKVRMCTRLKAHDWTDCPFAHPGEKARRRDPRRYSYSGTACTDFRKGSCRRGDACEFAHGVFECWLHPTRYRTQACKDGRNCTRRVCFFAHAPDQLRVVLGEPSPRSIGSGSDPFEDADPTGQSYGSSALHELVASIRNLQLSKVKSMQARPSWNFPVGVGAGSPGRFGSSGGSVVRPGFFSLPTTPTRPLGSEYLDAWEKEQEPTMERVESGRELRARMFEKLSKENPLSVSDPGESATSAPESGPDVGWVTDLVN